MTDHVLDSTALLVALFGEQGAERVDALLPNAAIGAVNLAEVVAKLQDRDVPDGEIERLLAELDVVAFDRAQPMAAGRLRSATRVLGLSLGDRCCLALAAHRGAVAVTADRAWATLDLPVMVEVVR